MAPTVEPERDNDERDVVPDYEYGESPGGTHQTLLRMVPDGARVLDVGCASGYLGEQLSRRGCRVWGVDADSRSVEMARSVGYEDVLCADLDRIGALPWEETFDVVIAADVLEHLTGPARILDAIRDRWLAPQGQLIVSLPNVANFTTRFGLLAGRFTYTEKGILDDTHLRLYTYRTARELLTSAGFAVGREQAGSNRFGAFLNGTRPGSTRLRGLLAFNVILTGTRASGG